MLCLSINAQTASISTAYPSHQLSVKAWKSGSQEPMNFRDYPKVHRDSERYLGLLIVFCTMSVKLLFAVLKYIMVKV